MNITQVSSHTPFISATPGDQRVSIRPETGVAVTTSIGSNRNRVTLCDETRQKLRNEKSEQSDNRGDLACHHQAQRNPQEAEREDQGGAGAVGSAEAKPYGLRAATGAAGW